MMCLGVIDATFAGIAVPPVSTHVFEFWKVFFDRIVQLKFSFLVKSEQCDRRNRFRHGVDTMYGVVCMVVSFFASFSKGFVIDKVTSSHNRRTSRPFPDQCPCR